MSAPVAPPPSRLLLGLALAGAAAFGAGIALELPWLRVATKPVPVLCLVALAVRGPAARGRGALVAGLVLSLVGDVALELDGWPGLGSGTWFVVGLGAFLLAHVAYIVSFSVRSSGLHPLRLLPFLLYAAAYLGLLWNGLGEMRPAVLAYVAVITGMLWRAASVSGPALVGALLFAASDSLIGLDRFHGAFPGVPYAIIALYWLGQWQITRSLEPSRT